MADLERKLKEEALIIPDSISPEQMKMKLDAMTSEEKARRSESSDIPSEEFAPVAKQNKVTGIAGYRRLINPLATAAALFIIFGLGIAIGKRGLGSKNASEATVAADSIAAADAEAADDSFETEAAEESAAPTEEAAGDKKGISFLGKNESTGSETDYDELYAYFDRIAGEQEEMLKEYAIDDMAVGDAITEDAEEDVADEAAPAAESAQSFSRDASQNGLTAAGDIAGAEAHGKDYSDTNVRTEGVMEGDIVKTDGEYIYVYNESTEYILIYKVCPEGQVEEAYGIIPLYPEIETGCEFYVNGNDLVMIGEERTIGEDIRKARTVIKTYDITDRDEPKLKSTLKQDGNYHSSRFVDGHLYTFSQKTVFLNEIEKKQPTTFIPQIEDDLIGPEDIYLQRNCKQTNYVVVTAMDPGSGTFTDREALLAGGSLLYVSNDHIYLADETYDWSNFMFPGTTEIVSFSYAGGKMEKQAEGNIPGSLNNDYSLDEKNGHLRLVTSYMEDGHRYNGLYILDENLQGISVVKKLAEGETIKSARFLGDMAYFVTFRNTDPLFAVDLSEETRPRVVGYLKIPGFSAYLHPFGEGLLLGIGYDTDEPENPIKLTMFDISDPENIKELHTEVLDGITDASVLQNRNAFYCRPDKNLFGFSLMLDDAFGSIGTLSYYALFSYDKDKGFSEALIEEVGEHIDRYTATETTRGLSIDDYFYIVTPMDKILSFDIKDGFKKVCEIEIR
ncbi:MAG: beta-propeller domain-containing protein [Lachnospiraceae bacterium]|nr:beta-propeller domain-containing protein [Lachnospiraceae bacterium]